MYMYSKIKFCKQTIKPVFNNHAIKSYHCFSFIEPLPPKDFTATSNSKGIMVSWTSPDYPPPDKIQYYKLVMTYLNDEKQTKDIKPNKNGDGSILMLSSDSSKTKYSFAITTAVKAAASQEGVSQLPCINESKPSEISIVYDSSESRMK